MAEGPAANLLKEYDKHCGSCAQFKERLERLIVQLLAENSIRVHSVSARVKGRHSFERKVDTAPSKYSKLTDITDVVGVRIITYFSDEVDQVATVIENEFEVDRHNSVDRRRLIDPDRFGYLSLHYVVRLSPARRQLAEYKRLSHLPAEIQIRSILQHAWAEIYHDLGYKSREAVPDVAVRDFARLAGLLELVDAEFVRLGDALRRHESDVAARIEGAPQRVGIDAASLSHLVTHDPMIRLLDQRIAGSHGRRELSRGMISYLATRLRLLGFRYVSELLDALRAHADDVVALANEYYDQEGRPTVLPMGISLTFLCDYIAIAERSERFYTDMELQLNQEDDPQVTDWMAERTIEAYRRLQSRRARASQDLQGEQGPVH